MAVKGPMELRLGSLSAERETVTQLHEAVLSDISNNEDQIPNEAQDQMIKGYREKEIALDEEIENLTADIERTNRAVQASKATRRIMAGGSGAVDEVEDGIAYRSMATYARDYILASRTPTCQSIQQQFASSEEIQQARERLEIAKRVPANTLSSDIAGISVAQHIDQIFQVINNSRPIVASATHADLVRGQLTYPSVDTRPVVAVQSSQKTEAGNTKMAVSLKTTTASTYLGGGDLSWQAINWSTPNALDLWFQLAAADYALKTEQDAASVITHSGYVITTPFVVASGTFANFITAVGAGAAGVWANSGRQADTIYMSMDAYYTVFGLTSSAFAQFATVADGRVGPFNFVPSRGLDAATIIIGDSSALLAAETPGAPVELRVVEPAIGGVEVGIIGAFEAVVVDPGGFIRVSSTS